MRRRVLGYVTEQLEASNAAKSKKDKPGVEYSMTCAYVSCGGYVCILQRARVFPVNQGGPADSYIRP